MISVVLGILAAVVCLVGFAASIIALYDNR